MRYKGGFNTYGQAIGVLVLETDFPRVPGDMGNATTFDFPVRFKMVEGATPEKVVQEQDPALLEPFIRAGRELAAEGVRGITTTCGFLAQFQRQLAAAVDVLIFATSLMQVPMVYRMLRPDQKVGIITADARHLHKGLLEAVGAGDVPVVIGGMENAHEFHHMRKVERLLDPDIAAQEVVATGQRLVAQDPAIGAFVMECANLPPYSKALQDATGLPVFDIVSLTRWVHSALVQRSYQGYL